MAQDRMSAAAFLAQQSPKPKRSKYGAQRTTVDGITFDSKHEAARWAQLVLMQRGRLISDLRRQVPIMLEGRDKPLMSRTGRQMRLTVDFAYFDEALGLIIYEDAKGMPTPDYNVRRAVAQAQGFEIIEV